jgi:hypothetical protein
MKRILLAVVALAALIYAGDDVIARIRHRPGADVKITRFLAIAQKFNKVEYDLTDPITEHCIQALLPHFGQQPCWYLRRHTVRFVNVG